MRIMFEMNKEQEALFEKLTALQKEIAINNISGMNDIDAYKASRGKSKKENTMRASVCEILANPNVKNFIKSMANHIVNPAVMSRQEMTERLSIIARGNLSDLIDWGETEEIVEGEVIKQSAWRFKGSDELTKEKMATISEVTSGVAGWYRIKQHSPLAAMKQLAELAGYEAPKQIEVMAKEELTPWGAISAAEDE
ncbi:terminase small subunit [Shewanella sp. phage 1/41]|uniref:terminase small subunit n=1 Tax=Shewanella sp. phage 1/41 TaxID=1458861 RepID=UPI0004F5F2EC|nr:terminase small subunit [Shewanella sp. phage 1/41]AHK11655.1 terminase small subunit [Shewanella sp. phage 1/41]